VTVSCRVHKPTKWDNLMLKDTCGNDVLCDNLYLKQIKRVVADIEMLKGHGIEVMKYSNWGMLEIPVVEDVDTLHTLIAGVHYGNV
jgi:hypothetical protein